MGIRFLLAGGLLGVPLLRDPEVAMSEVESRGMEGTVQFLAGVVEVS